VTSGRKEMRLCNAKMQDREEEGYWKIMCGSGEANRRYGGYFTVLPSQGNCRASLRDQHIRGKDDPVSEFTILRHLTRRPK
jgi:hypothetical protein